MLGGKLCVLVWTNFQYLESAKTCRHKAKELLHCYRFAILHFSFLKILYFRMTQGLFGKREKMK